LPLDPGRNVFDFVAVPVGAREYLSPPARLCIYRSDDVDEDGLADFWEEESFGSLVWGSADDPDGDGLTNEAEFYLGTLPNDNDTDGDSMPDGWEALNGLNPTSDLDASQDADGDGLTNLAEYLAGADPLNPRSPFAILALSRGGATLELVWYSVPGKTYQVLSSGDMDLWTAISDPIIADGTECSFVDDDIESQVRFYSIELLQ